MRTINDIIYLQKSIVPSESRILLQKLLNVTLEKLILITDKTLSEEQYKDFLELCSRRIAGEPIAYILGSKEFYGRIFEVNRDVLIPRPETELVIDEAVSFLRTRTNPCFFDLCTGSGCIAISVALELNDSKAFASDISKEALNVAKRNAKKLGACEQISFFESNWFDKIPSEKFDLICCNPPYISTEEKEILSKEVIDFEPHQALFAEISGLLPYKILASQAKDFLKEDGRIILECGHKQSGQICSIFENLGWKNPGRIKDLSGIERCLIFSK